MFTPFANCTKLTRLWDALANVGAMRRSAFAFALLIGLASPASADIWNTCNASTNIEMTQCIWERFKAADAELNVVWKQVNATIAPSEFLPAEQASEWKAKLLNAQRAWVTFKEEDCRGAVAYEWFGGSGANAAIGACLYAHTSARIEDLRERYLNR
jgi:uncharacterized protein YecT (DUF1311 family)